MAASIKTINEYEWTIIRGILCKLKITKLVPLLKQLSI